MFGITNLKSLQETSPSAKNLIRYSKNKRVHGAAILANFFASSLITYILIDQHANYSDERVGFLGSMSGVTFIAGMILTVIRFQQEKRHLTFIDQPLNDIQLQIIRHEDGAHIPVDSATLYQQITAQSINPEEFEL